MLAVALTTGVLWDVSPQYPEAIDFQYFVIQFSNEHNFGCGACTQSLTVLKLP